MSGLNHLCEPERDPVVVTDAAIDPRVVTRAHQAIPVWVRLTFDDDRSPRTEKGFALAWTERHVFVQVLWMMSYYRAAREFWVDSHQTRRRTIEPQWLGRPA